MKLLWLLIFIGNIVYFANSTRSEDKLRFEDKNGNEYRIYLRNVLSDTMDQFCKEHEAIVPTLQNAEQIEFIRQQIDVSGVTKVMTNIKYCQTFMWPNNTEMDPNLVVRMKPVTFGHFCKPCSCVILVSEDTSVTSQSHESSGDSPKRSNRGFLCQTKTNKRDSRRGKNIPASNQEQLLRPRSSSMFRKTTSLPHDITNEDKQLKKQKTGLDAMLVNEKTKLSLRKWTTAPKKKGIASKRNPRSTVEPGDFSESTSSGNINSSSKILKETVEKFSAKQTFSPERSTSQKPAIAERQFDHTIEIGVPSKDLVGDELDFGSRLVMDENGSGSDQIPGVDTPEDLQRTSRGPLQQPVNLVTSFLLDDNQSRPASSTRSKSLPVNSTVTSRNRTAELEEILQEFQRDDFTRHLPVATNLLKSVNEILESEHNRSQVADSPSSGLAPAELLYVGTEVFESVAPKNLVRGPQDNAEETTVEAERIRVEEYALNFMKVTSAMLNEKNTKSWTEVVAKQDASKSDGLTPTTLLETLDEVIEYWLDYMPTKANETRVMVNTSSLAVRVETLDSDRPYLDVTAAGSLSEATWNGNGTRINGTRSAVVTALYKTVPQLLNACMDYSRAVVARATTNQTVSASPKFGPVASRQDGVTPEPLKGNVCSRMGYPVSDSLCERMFGGLTSEESNRQVRGYWTFPQSSDVLSITAYQHDGQNKYHKRTVPTKFQIKGGDNQREAKCVFYDVDKNIWSDYGCKNVSTRDNVSTCFCNHTTNFAILLLVPVAPSLEKNVLGGLGAFSENWHVSTCPQMVKVMSYVAGGLSIAFLLASILFFAYGRQSSERTLERNTIHMCFAISMLCLHIILLADTPQETMQPLVDASEQDLEVRADWTCHLIAALTHYFLLCNFSWMTLEGILLYLLVVAKELRRKTIGKWKHVIGWLLPLLIVGVTLAIGLINKDSYVRLTDVVFQSNSSNALSEGVNIVTHRYVCYLAKDLSWAAFVPVACCLALNFFIAVRVLSVIARLTKESRRYKPTFEHLSESAMNIKAVKKSFTAFCKLNPILGFPWLLGFASSFVPEPYQCSVMMAHTSLNALQGVFFFIVCVVQNEESRALIHVTWRKVRHNTQSFVSTFRLRKSSSYPFSTPIRQKRCSNASPGGGEPTRTTPIVNVRATRATHKTNDVFKSCDNV